MDTKSILEVAMIKCSVRYNPKGHQRLGGLQDTRTDGTGHDRRNIQNGILSEKSRSGYVYNGRPP